MAAIILLCDASATVNRGHRLLLQELAGMGMLPGFPAP